MQLTSPGKRAGPRKAGDETMYATGLMRAPRPTYFLAIFFSAFLLFQVQALIAKIILPWFGGGEAVWIVCLLFFQIVLLLGYLYAHFLTQFVPAGAQPWVHAGAVLVSFAALPIFPEGSWVPQRAGEALWRTFIIV